MKYSFFLPYVELSTLTVSTCIYDCGDVISSYTQFVN